MNVTFFSGFLSASNFNEPVTKVPSNFLIASLIASFEDKSETFFNAVSKIVPVSYPKAAKIIGSILYSFLYAAMNFCTF